MVGRVTSQKCKGERNGGGSTNFYDTKMMVLMVLVGMLVMVMMRENVNKLGSAGGGQVV